MVVSTPDLDLIKKPMIFPHSSQAPMGANRALFNVTPRNGPDRGEDKKVTRPIDDLG